MPHQQGSSFLEGVKYYLKKGQSRVIRFRWRTYTFGIMLHSLLDFVLTNDLQTREVALAYDLTVPGKLEDIKNFRDKLAIFGSKYRYFPKSTKLYLIVKKNA